LPIDCNDAAVIGALIEVIAFDLARVQDELPHIVTMVVSRAFTLKPTFYVLIEILKVLRHSIVERVQDLLFKFFRYLLL
jgi:hypothetical protein